MRRVIAYSESEPNTDRATERKALGSKLEAALRTAFATGAGQTEPNAIAPAVTAIENVEPRRTLLLRRALADILARLDANQPKLPRDGGTIEELLHAINESQETVADAAKLSEAIAVMPDEDSALEMYRWFGAILERYDLPRNFSGHFNTGDFDYFKFIGYEIFTDLIAVLLRENRWAILQRLLSERIPVKYLRPHDGPGSAYWNSLSEWPPLLMGHGERNGRLSLQADIVHQHHTKGALEPIVPLDDFLAADFFLYLRTCGSRPPNGNNKWNAWSYPYLEHVPMFLRYAERKEIATALAKTFGASGIDDLKTILVEAIPALRRLFQRGILRTPVQRADIDQIGSVD